MNYIIAEKELINFKNELTVKYGKGYKGSTLTDTEIDRLFELKEQLNNNTVGKQDFLKQVVSR